MQRNLVKIGDRYYTPEIAAQIREADEMVEKYDLLQLTKKIQLNSLYGALLSTGFRWGFEEKIGASVTYTGRAITTFMLNTAAELLTGINAKLKKTFQLEKVKDKYVVFNVYNADNDFILASDTDSGYFKTGADNIDDAVLIADEVCQEINKAFVPFMRNAFGCIPGYDTLISAGREIVAERVLFQARKKYIAKCVDVEGIREVKIKAQGSEIKKSDTPKIIQKFLKNVLEKILDGVKYDQLSNYVNEQRKKLFQDNIAASEVILLGTAKGCNNFDYYSEVYFSAEKGNPIKKNGRKVTVPGHIRAAVNYNVLLVHYNDTISPRINNGDKVKVFQLKRNDFGFDTIAFPGDISKFPEWFIDNFDLDLKLSEEKLITAKLEGIFSCMGLEVPSPQRARVASLIEF